MSQDTLQDHDIVCFGPSDWWGMNPSSATHIMGRLATCNRVLYINPVSSDILSLRRRKGIGTRIVRKLKSMLRFLRREDSNLYVMSPMFIPVQGHSILDAVNNILLRTQLAAAMLLLRFNRPLLWVENIRAADCIEWLNWRLIVYHASDKFDECCNTHNKHVLQQREKLISDRSDIIICASRKLYESKKMYGKNVYYLPHGVDVELFCSAAKEPQSYVDLAGASAPIAGYFGTLTDQNDIDLLEYCAESLPHVRFVLAGRITGGDYGKLRKMPNVRFLGHVPYEQIPHLCACFDVCLLPWRMSPWIEHCNPLKLFEYMASGKPIVSVPIYEVCHQYADIISVAETREQFCAAIEAELANDTDERRELRIQTAGRHTWENHIARLSSIVADVYSDCRRRNLRYRAMHLA